MNFARINYGCLNPKHNSIFKMLTENGVSLQVDSQKRICVTDVINMLKGLRSENVIKIVKTSEQTENKVLIFDTTLRDGEQAPGCSMSLREKLKILRQHEELQKRGNQITKKNTMESQ